MSKLNETKELMADVQFNLRKLNEEDAIYQEVYELATKLEKMINKFDS